MSFKDAYKWKPEYMAKHGLTHADIWRDINRTRARSAIATLLAAIAGGLLLGITIKG